MAEEFINRGGVCSGTWRNPSRNELFPGSLSPRSGAAGDVTGLCWLVESNTASLTSSASSDWTQAFLGGVDSDGKRASNQTDFNSNSDIMHESGSSDSSQIHSGWAPGLTGSFAPEPAQDHEDSSPMSAFKNQTDLPAQTSEAYANHDISSSFGYPSTMKNFLLEQPPPLLEGRLDLPEEDYTSYLVPSYRQSCSDDLSSASSGKLSSLLNPNTSSLPKPYWNSSMSALDDTQAGLLASPQSALASSSADEKLNCSNSIAKVNGSTKKKVNPEPALKRPRIETPSPLPTFKVRKEKLGDRITALQQLVSPFGKTDTASVLHEAIEYIKFLHDQVNALSTLYRKNDGAPSQQHQRAPTDRTLEDSEGPKMDLRSRGLCLVPTSSTFPVACQAPNDFWTPTFGGSFL